MYIRVTGGLSVLDRGTGPTPHFADILMASKYSTHFCAQPRRRIHKKNPKREAAVKMLEFRIDSFAREIYMVQNSK